MRKKRLFPRRPGALTVVRMGVDEEASGREVVAGVWAFEWSTPPERVSDQWSVTVTDGHHTCQ